MVKYLRAYYLELLIFTYILGNAYVLVYRKDNFYEYNLIPIALIIGYVAVFHLQKLVYFLAFVTPLAISLKEMGLTETQFNLLKSRAKARLTELVRRKLARNSV